MQGMNLAQRIIGRKMMKDKGMILMMMLFVGVAYSDSQQMLPHFQQPKHHIYTAGQPTEAGFRELQSMGVKVVINVLPAEECLAGEESDVASHKMLYLTLPFDPYHFDRQTIEHFGQILYAHRNQPILIHCSTGNHVGGLWFAYRVLFEGAPLGDALKEGRKIGMQLWLENPLLYWVVEERDKMREENESRAS
jgi:protein tyrosine phosphatase (PTP) superfamily phosphohydrolase (DUF442 family)